jgi:hypothetical protein
MHYSHKEDINQKKLKLFGSIEKDTIFVATNINTTNNTVTNEHPGGH